LFDPKSFIFCDLNPHAKLQNPTITPSGRKITQRREEGEKRNNAVNTALAPLFRDSARIPLVPINNNGWKINQCLDSENSNCVYLIECKKDNCGM
jgi:hypothetical protein